MKYLYGPVKSRRLGLSLGISLTPKKVCSFDCVYCQLGKTTDKTFSRQEYVNIDEIIIELKEFLKTPNSLDYITLSGFGEPTLNINIEKLIKEIKKLATTPLVLITNASLFSKSNVRHEVLGVDVIIPSLDAVTQDIFEKIDRPAKGIKIEDILNGLIELRKEFKGNIYLEIMLVCGINDSLRYITKFKEAVKMINPDKIQLNTPVRCTADFDIGVPDKETLLKIRDILGSKCEVI